MSGQASQTLAQESDPVGDSAAALQHLRLLWPDGPPQGSLITTWKKRDGARQFVDLEAVATDLCSAPGRLLACAVMGPVQRGRRGGTADALAVPGAWADLDVIGGAHVNQALPTDEELVALLSAFPLEPSFQILSGGGRYPWWLFDEPLLITTEDIRRRARALLGGLQDELLARGRERGWVFDKTADLARCLRAPGTLNGKYSPPRLVRLAEPIENAVRYPLSEFERFLPAKSRRKRTFAAPAPAEGSATSSSALWFHRAADLLGGHTKDIEVDGHVTAVVLRTCPCCQGAEQSGTAASATAHISRKSGMLKCKRASCAAYEGNGGLAPERWIIQFLPAKDVGEIRTLWAQDPDTSPWCTDDGNAVRFVRRHGLTMRWCEALGWLEWRGPRWIPGSDVRALDYARETAKAIAVEAALIKDEEEQDRVYAFAAQSQQAPRLRAMIELARCELQVRAEELDQNLWMLNVENGQLDLRTGELKAHDPKSLCTKLAPVRYDPNARCPDLDRFLAAVTCGDVEYQAYLKRLLGYTLVGEQSEDVVILLLGPGNSGKTTLLEATHAALGDYAATIPFDALLERKGNRAGPTPELLKLRGARLAKAAEAAEGSTFDAAILKSIAGGDTLTARDLYRGPVQFRPQCTLWLAANCPPDISKGDSGARRRLRILPFIRVVDDDIVDKSLRVRLQQPEARAALLAMAVRGCLAWQKQGIGTCTAVEHATTAYWEGQEAADLLPRFLDAECVTEAGAWTATASIRERIQAFARAAGTKCPGDKALAGFMRASGCTEARKAQARGWRGLRLRTPDARGEGPMEGAAASADDAMTGVTPIQTSSSTQMHAGPHTHARTHARVYMGEVSTTRHGVTGVMDPAPKPLPDSPTYCFGCRGSRWWRLKTSASWTCGRCHPPMQQPDAIEWREGAAS